MSPAKRTVKDWEVDGETRLLSTGDKGEGFRKAHAIIRARDFTHRRVVGFAYRAEDARLFAAAGALLEALEGLIVWAEYTGGWEGAAWKDAAKALAKAKS